MGNNSLTKILGDAGIDNTHCKGKSDKYLMENERKETFCPKWGIWISGQCDASCGIAKKRITRECFLGDQSVDTNECAKEYSTDSVR